MTRSTRWAAAAVGLAVAFTPALFVTASVLKYEAGWSWPYDALAGLLTSRTLPRFSPLLLLGALALALGLNVYATSRLALGGGSEAARSRLGLARRAANLVVIAASALLLAVLAGYLILGVGAHR
jgi:hypothetical protein